VTSRTGPVPAATIKMRTRSPWPRRLGRAGTEQTRRAVRVRPRHIGKDLFGLRWPVLQYSWIERRRRLAPSRTNVVVFGGEGAEVVRVATMC